jgi:two-component system cell cycle sensor histidine kinase/response regulator CckA
VPPDAFQWSDEMYELFKLPRDVPVTLDAVLSVIHPEDHASNDGSAVQKALKSGRVDFQSEFRIIWPDGQIRWALSIGKIRREVDGQVVEAVGTVQDITERKQAEAALIEERHLLHTLMDNLPDLIYFKDRASQFTRINLAVAKRFGLSHPEQAVGKTDFDFYGAEHAQEAYRDEQEIIRTGQPVVGKEEKEVWPDGRATWVSTTKMPLRDAEGDIIGTFGVSRDFTERKHAEEELSFKTALLEAQSETTIDGILVVDMTDHVVLVNREFSRIWGFAEDEVPTRDDRKLIEIVKGQIKDPEAFLERVRYLNSHATEKSRDELELKDGRVYDRYSAPLRGSTGKLYGRIWYFRDITMRKQAENAIWESEERYRTLFENAPVGIYRTSPDGRILEANPALVRMLGYSSFQELAGRDLNASGFEPDYPRSHFLEMVEQRGEAAGLESVWLRKDGSALQVRENARPIRDNSGRLLYYEGTVEDITQYKQSEGEHIRLVTAIEQSVEAVVITNAAGSIEYVNPAFTHITGYSREEVLGKNPRLWKSDKQDPLIYRQLWSTIMNGEVWRGEIINRRKDGSYYSETINIAPVCSTHGEITHFIATKQDISGRKLLEQQLFQAQKMEAVGRLAGGLAHDFNNLLTIINGYASILLHKIRTEDPRRDHVNEIAMAGTRAATLTRQLLAFSRRQVLEPRVLDLNLVVADIEKMLRRLIGEDIDLVTTLDPGVGRIKVDPGQIEQVVMNLAVNARDAMPEGGEFLIETSNVEIDEEFTRRHNYVAPGNYVRMVVSDTGCGMSLETQSHIFEPFFTTKEKGRGTGLGLATVYGIVKQSSGFIWVQSAPGKGAWFTILFPRIEADLPTQDHLIVEAHSAMGSETVMVVEDEIGVRSLACQVLISQGYKVLQAGGGAQALRTVQEYTGPIHLLLTDVVMPKIGGKELARRFSALHPETKVLYMSGYTDDAVIRSGILRGDSPFLQKPFTEDQLGRKVREVLNMKSRGHG